MPNMQNGMGLPSSYVFQEMQPSAHGGQDMYCRQGPKVVDVPSLQPQPVSQMSYMQSQMMGMQVIALPVGAAPPEGAIPMPAGAVPEQVLQMIAVPAGEAPPEGAVLVGEAPQVLTARTSQSESTSASSESRRVSNKAFKIKDPRTGIEVSAPQAGEESAAAPRRLRIVNPKTGEEVRL